ncbi:hypothetical protein DPSP01_011577 [Paraphaeosphaeria sporulosa]
MPIRITILIKKLDTVSTEDFHSYWSTKHPSIFLSVPTAQKLLLRYSQYHISRPLTTALRKGAHMPCLEPEFDGAAEFLVESLEDFGTIFADPIYESVVVPDEESFLKRGESMVFVGEEEMKWVDGKAAEGVVLK